MQGVRTVVHDAAAVKPVEVPSVPAGQDVLEPPVQ
jgi:hypothetical protein